MVDRATLVLRRFADSPQQVAEAEDMKTALEQKGFPKAILDKLEPADWAEIMGWVHATMPQALPPDAAAPAAAPFSEPALRLVLTDDFGRPTHVVAVPPQPAAKPPVLAQVPQASKALRELSLVSKFYEAHRGQFERLGGNKVSFLEGFHNARKLDASITVEEYLGSRG